MDALGSVAVGDFPLLETGSEQSQQSQRIWKNLKAELDECKVEAMQEVVEVLHLAEWKSLGSSLRLKAPSSAAFWFESINKLDGPSTGLHHACGWRY